MEASVVWIRESITSATDLLRVKTTSEVEVFSIEVIEFAI
jgi:hypothetical protein